MGLGVCEPPSAGGPRRSDPTKAGSTTSANFTLLLLNRLYLSFMLPCFS